MNLQELKETLTSNEAFKTYIITIIGIIVGWFSGLFRWIFNRIKIWYQNKKAPINRIPKQTLKIVPRPFSARWSVGKENGKSIVHLAIDFYITNIYTSNVKVLDAYLKKEKVHTRIVSVRHPHSNIHGRYPILPGETTESIVSFTIDSKKVSGDRPYFSDIVLVDQFGNQHLVKKIEFKCMFSKVK